MYGIYANIGGILMVNVNISSIHGSYGIGKVDGRLLASSTLGTMRVGDWEHSRFPGTRRLFRGRHLSTHMRSSSDL